MPRLVETCAEPALNTAVAVRRPYPQCDKTRADIWLAPREDLAVLVNLS